jgi:hypothetical protein
MKLPGKNKEKQDLFARKPIRWKDRVANLRKQSAFFSKTAKSSGSDRRGTDLIRWIAIQRPGSYAGAGGGGLTGTH